MKQEANISLVLRHYLKANPIPFSCPIEVKDTRGKMYFNFKELKDKQVNNALASKSSKGNLIRISGGTVGGPDYAWYFKTELAPIFIHYPKHLIIIDIEAFLLAKKDSKSLSLEKAKDIAHKVIFL